MKKTSTKPTHTLCMKPRGTTPKKESWVAVGSGWEHENDTGSYIAIRLNRGVTLTWRDMEDMKLALFEAYK